MQDRNQQDRHERIQLHLELPYKFDPVDHYKIKSYLDRGFRVEDLQRITDREAVVTLRRDPAPGG